jgi:putative ABC transport system substrate-binding protein
MRKDHRRNFLLAAAALIAAPRVARAQAQKRLPVLGILRGGRKPSPEALAKFPLLIRLGELGWVEGKTISIEYAAAASQERFPDAAAALAAKKVDVIWTAGPPGAVAAARSTSSIPIVFWRVGYPVESGLVDSLARPGRNVTGMAWYADDRILLKRPGLLRDLAPDARRHALLTVRNSNPTVAGGMLDLKPMLDKVDAAYHLRGFEARRFELVTSADLDPALAAIAKWAPHSLNVPDTVPTAINRNQIVDFARRQRLIDFYETIEWVQAGGLMSYGVSMLPGLLRTAEMVDRILRGTKPADMPVELPSHFELVLNLARAKSLHLKVPQSILIRADRVIE